MKSQPSLIEVVQAFSTEEKCIGHLERIRFPEGVKCPKCGGERISKFESEGKTGKVRHLYECMPCHYQFSITAGTIFHDSHMSLMKWFLAIYLICSAKKGVSSKQLQRELGVTYKTAWYMAHRIRLAMSEDSEFCRKFSGIVEVDETYVGGKSKGRTGRGSANKIPVVGMRERTSGHVRMQAIQNVKRTTLQEFIRKNAEPGSEVHTDDFSSYLWLDSSEFAHYSVNHNKEWFRKPDIHTNGIENVWSLFKRGIMGAYHKVSGKYLPLYLDEFSFRYNNRGIFNMMDRVLQTIG